MDNRREIVDRKAVAALRRKPLGGTILVPHSFRTLKGLTWPVCSSCGLVRLRNATTEECCKIGHWKYLDE